MSTGRLLVFGCLVALGACASSGATPQPFPKFPTQPAPPAEPSAVARARPDPPGPAAGYAIAGTALSLRGAPYRDGGSDPSGFDCSGFVRYVFAQHGVRVPRTVGEQYQAGGQAADPLQAGDLVFFATTGGGPSHVGILIGGDEFVHAPSSKGVVRVERLGAPYWSARYLGARRVQ